MKIITISGLDGSGKSTQIELLKNHLEEHGKKVFYFHAIQFGLANKLTNKKDSKASPGVTKASWSKIFLRKVFLLIDMWRFKRLFKDLDKKKFDYILSDRYFYDTVINIEYLSNKQGIKYEIQKPDLAIYLQVNPEAIMSRDRVPDQGLEYLQKKKGLYDRYVDIFGMKIISGNSNKEEIFNEIKKMVDIL